ncbi:ABC transporter permease [Candidatus Dependentiae bacterium]|nr:ABC transporter permease [Candidatus Dependentiae bacterium]
MKLYRIQALALRTLKLTFRGLDPLVDFFYWPLFDIVVWGFTSRWIQAQTHTSSFVILLALVLWQAAYRSNLDISFNLLSEIWSRNIVNLFSTPLTIGEWMIASMAVGVLNTLISVSFGALAIWFLYGVSLFKVGWLLLPFFVSLMLSGWTIGFFTASSLVYWGQSVQKLVWVMGWFFVPFSAVYYPIGSLPHGVQLVAYCLPMTYIFEGLRSYMQTGTVPLNYILISYVLNGVYLTSALVWFRYMFNQSRVKGLARLEND